MDRRRLGRRNRGAGRGRRTPATARRAGLGPGRCGPRRRRGGVTRQARRPGGSAPPAEPGSASGPAVCCARAARGVSRRPSAAFHRRGRGRPRSTLGAVSGAPRGAAARRHGARALPVLVSRRPHDRLFSEREAAANRRGRRSDPDDLRGGWVGFRRVLERERRDRVLRDFRRPRDAGSGRRRNPEARDHARREARRRGPPVSLVSAGRTAVCVRRAQRRPPQVIRRRRRSRRGCLGRAHPLSGRFERGLGTAGLSALRPRRDALRAEIRRQARGPGGRPRRCDGEHPVPDRRESGGSVGRRRPAGLRPLAARPPPRVGGSPGPRDGHARTRRRLRGRPDFSRGRSGRRVHSKSGGELESRRLGRGRRPRRRLSSLDRAVRRVSFRLDSRRPEADLYVGSRRLLRSLREVRQRRARNRGHPDGLGQAGQRGHPGRREPGLRRGRRREKTKMSGSWLWTGTGLRNPSSRRRSLARSPRGFRRTADGSPSCPTSRAARSLRGAVSVGAQAARLERRRRRPGLEPGR